MTTASAGDRAGAMTATTRTVTHINRTAILDALQDHGPLSRAQLREITGLGSATVQRLCAGLLEEGFIAQEGVQSASVGRPSHLFRYSGEGRIIAALDITDSAVRAVLVNLDGKTVEDFSQELARDDGSIDADARLDGTLAAIDELIARAQRRKQPCLAIGISAPGLVSSEGVVSNSVELGWQALPLGSIVRSRYDIPVLIENDANAVAFAEWALGNGGATSSLVAYVFGVGIGAGLISEGRLVRGHHAAAGEIGYLLPHREALQRFYPDQGAFEATIFELGRSHSSTRRSTIAEHIDAMADDPSPEAEELYDYLALSIAAISTVIAPDRLVFAGHVPQRADRMIERIGQRLLGRIPHPPELSTTTLGEKAALVGVAELAMRKAKGSAYLA